MQEEPRMIKGSFNGSKQPAALFSETAKLFSSDAKSLADYPDTMRQKIRNYWDTITRLLEEANIFTHNLSTVATEAGMDNHPSADFNDASAISTFAGALASIYIACLYTAKINKIKINYRCKIQSLEKKSQAMNAYYFDLPLDADVNDILKNIPSNDFNSLILIGKKTDKHKKIYFIQNGRLIEDKNLQGLEINLAQIDFDPKPYDPVPDDAECPYHLISDEKVIGQIIDRIAEKEFAVEYLTQMVNKLNPWYRRFKTCAVLGGFVGQLIGSLLPLRHVPVLNLMQPFLAQILGGVFAIILGIAGAAFLPDTIIKKIAGLDYFRLGNDGWTKYAKTGMVFGTTAGLLIGTIIGTFVCPAIGSVLGGAVGSAIGGILGFALSFAAVPCANWVSEKFSESKMLFNLKNINYRSNYIRAGLVLGSSIGGFIGLLIGTFAFPGLGSVAGLALGSSIGAIVMGAAAAIAGPFISRRLDPNNKAANSWDYGIRTGSMFGNNYGLAPVLNVIPVVGPFIAAIAPTIGAAIGFIREVLHQRGRKMHSGNVEDDNTHILSWSQRVASAMVLACAVGGFIGIFVPFPGATAVLAGSFGFVTGLVCLLADPGAWHKFSSGCKKFTRLFQVSPEYTIVSANDAVPKVNNSAWNTICGTLGKSNLENLLHKSPSTESVHSSESNGSDIVPAALDQQTHKSAKKTERYTDFFDSKFNTMKQTIKTLFMLNEPVVTYKRPSSAQFSKYNIAASRPITLVRDQ